MKLGMFKSNAAPFHGRKFEVRVNWPLLRTYWYGFSVNEGNFPNFAVHWRPTMFVYIAITPGIRWSKMWGKAA